MSYRDHAELSPSSSEQWLTCPGSIPLSRGQYTDAESPYAVEGTDHHEVAALCLEKGYDATQLVNKAMLSGAILTNDNALYLQTYLDTIRGYVDTLGGSLKVEEGVSIEFLTGEPGGRGKADAVIFLPIPELIVVDLKFGMGVEVSPEQNTQEMLYAAGVIEKHQLWDEVKHVRLVIVQPRVYGAPAVKEWLCPIAVLKTFCEGVKASCRHIATLVGGAKYLGGANKDVMREVGSDQLHPSEKGCKFCPAKATCPALVKVVRTVLSGSEGFVDERPTPPLSLGEQMDLSGLVETWLHAIRAKVEVELLAGRAVQGKDGFYKLVRGRAGDRKWDDADAVEEFLKTCEVEEAVLYKKTFITAAAAEKIFKRPRPELWTQLEGRITRSQGALSVADPLDKRPAVVQESPTAGFEIEDGSDLI